MSKAGIGPDRPTTSPESESGAPSAGAAAGLPTWVWVLFAIALLALPTSLMLVRGLAPDTSHLRDLGAVPSFSLVDQTGATVDGESLAGSVLVVDFIFTRCPSMCPQLTTAMAELQARLPAELDGTPIRLISISVDPDFDTPQVLAKYAAKNGVDATRWSLLTGEGEVVRQVIADFKQVAEPIDKDGDGISDDIAHSLRFLVLDGDRVIRAIHAIDPESLDALELDVRTLAEAGGS